MTSPTRRDIASDHDRLPDAFELGGHEHLAIVGGGGKTTLLHALGMQLTGRRVLTSTTKMGHDQDRGLPVLVGATDDEVVAASADGPIVAWAAIDGHKAVGVDPDTCDRWFARVDHVICEADGSRRRPFKAPAPYEPVVASTVTTMISVIGVDALGRAIDQCCHRPELVAAIAGCTSADPLTPGRAAAVLLHPDGARRELPPGAELVVAVTKVDTGSRPQVDRLCEAIETLDPGQRVVTIGTGAGHGPVRAPDGAR